MCPFMKNEMVCYEIQNDVNLQIEFICTSCSKDFIKSIGTAAEGNANSLTNKEKQMLEDYSR
jgi:transposase-like protein